MTTRLPSTDLARSGGPAPVPRWRWPWLAPTALAVAAVLAVGLQAQRRRHQPPGGPAAPAGNLVFAPGQGAGPDPLVLFEGLSRGGLEAALVQRPGDQPLVGEPAGLPPFPIPEARRSWGVRRQEDDLVEEVAVWRLPEAAARLAQVTAHYESMALAAGFQPAARPRPAATARTADIRLFLRSRQGPARPQECLTVRAAVRGRDVELTLRLVH